MKFFYFFSLIFFLAIVSCEPNENMSEVIPHPSLPILAEKMKDSIQIIAHGGASAYKPFNSISAFTKAFELSADGIEIDLIPSADDSIMVFHDLNTKKITGVDYNMVDTNAAVLRTLDIGNGEQMPFLSEVFKILPYGKKIYLEVKWYQDTKARDNVGLIDKLISQIEKSGKINDCVILCFNKDYLLKIKLKKPELKCFWITSDANGSKLISDVLFNYNFEGGNVQWPIINTELAKSLIDRNQLLFAWTVNDEKLIVELYQKYKINGIYTDKPDRMRLALARFF